MSSPILFSCDLETGQPLSGDAVSETLLADDLAWVHLDAAHDDTRDWLEQNVSYLDKIVLDALLAQETRPRFMQYKDGALIILRGVNLNDNADPEDMISIRLWIDPHRIISMRLRPLKAIGDIKDMIENGTGPKTAGNFMTALTTSLFKRMEPVILELDQRTDDIEEKILEDADIKARHEIIDIRKMAIMLRRYIAPQKDALLALRNTDLLWLEALHKRQLQENLDRLSRYLEDLEAIRERAQIVKDELANIMSDRMNKNMYVLSIVAAIFLPLGFFTGLLGINVGGMPGAEYDLGFWIVCAVCGGLSLFILVLFRLLKWI